MQRFAVQLQAVENLTQSVKPVAKAVGTVGRYLPVVGNVIEAGELSVKSVSRFHNGERKSGAKAAAGAAISIAGVDVVLLNKAVKEVGDLLKARLYINAAVAVMTGMAEGATSMFVGRHAGGFVRESVRAYMQHQGLGLYAPQESALREIKREATEMKDALKDIGKAVLGKMSPAKPSAPKR